MSEVDLASVLNFTEEDLQANRAGRLSESQRRLYFQRERGGLLSGMVVIVFFALIGSVMAMNGRVWLGAVFILISVALVIATRIGRGERVSEVNANRVECVSGQVLCERTTINSAIGRRYEHRVSIGTETFVVSLPVYDVLCEQEELSAYYLAYNRLILSASPRPHAEGSDGQ